MNVGINPGPSDDSWYDFEIIDQTPCMCCGRTDVYGDAGPNREPSPDPLCTACAMLIATSQRFVLVRRGYGENVREPIRRRARA